MTTGFVEAARREKLKELLERGVAPFAYRFERTATAQQALAAYKSDDDPARYALAGRLVALRPHGKTTFAHLEDQSGKIQLYFKGDELGAERYTVLELLDLGDHVGVEGRLMKTRTGEITLRVAGFTLLSKALRPLPLGKEDASGVKHGELTDPELRSRQRYADLAVHPEVREVFRLRTRIVQGIRAFLDAKGYLEVETPVLQPLYGGASAWPFKTHYEALDATFYLRIADELYLKRCLVGGLEKVYEIGHDFRNEGLSRFHNPEFTMAEWYQAYADYNDVAALTEELLAGLVLDVFKTRELTRHGTTLSFARPFARKDYYALVREHAGVDLTKTNDAELRGVLKQHNAPPADVAALSGPKLIESSSTRSSRPVSSPSSCSPRSYSTIRSRCHRSPSPSAAIRPKSSGGSCSCSIASWRMRSASSTIPTSSAAASSSRPRCAPRATPRRSSWTRIFCVRWSTACRPRAAWDWAWTA